MKKKQNIGIIGLGLMGGSLAIALRKLEYIGKIYGVDQSSKHAERAVELGLVDTIETLENAIVNSNIIILATPVDVIAREIGSIFNLISDQAVFDVGSTKKAIIDALEGHSKRGRFVACHPMAGTEYSGPDAAIEDLYSEKYNVICNAEESDESALLMVESLLSDIGMKLIYQKAGEHDTHVAYVSHMSHISAFALALTVLHKEKSEQQIFQLASGGFRSSVRLAKSNPLTWQPIFEQNRDAVMDVLDEHITVLSKFRSLLIKQDFNQFGELMKEANQIKRILHQETEEVSNKITQK